MDVVEKIFCHFEERFEIQVMLCPYPKREVSSSRVVIGGNSMRRLNRRIGHLYVFTQAM